MSKVRHYCATFFKEPMHLPEGVRYAIYGHEICPSTGREHWQSYLEFFNPQRIAAVKKMYQDNTVHCEIRRGTRDEAKIYCMKDGKFQEFGLWISGQGYRSDLHTITQNLINGTQSLETIMLEQPEIYCRNRNGLKDIAAACTKKKTKDFRHIEVTLLTGPTGCGKTRQAMEQASYKINATDLDWWQDYDGDNVICIDEYDNNVPITKMLNILDGYQLRLNQKGSHTYANWTKVFITTNLKVDEIHTNAKKEHRNALKRRITKVINFWDEGPQVILDCGQL